MVLFIFSSIPHFQKKFIKYLQKIIWQLDDFEAFTTGVVCDEGATELELNLNKLDNTPDGFRYPENPDLPKLSSTRPSASRGSKSVKKRMKK